MADAYTVVIDDDTETVRVDPETGTIETVQPDGGVVVQLDAKRSKSADGENEFLENLVDKIDAQELALIAEELYASISEDDNSRSGHLSNIARGLDLTGLKLEEPRANVGDASVSDGMSVVTNPLLLDTLLKGWAGAQGEMLPASGPVKIRDDGPVSEKADDLAEALERDMNHYMTKVMTEYYPDTSHMLLWGTYFAGSGFKKVYRCPMRRRPTSESVSVQDFIVSDTTKDLRNCARITHQIKMRQSVMKRMQLLGAYRSITLADPTPQPNQVGEKIAGIQGTNSNQTRPEDRPYTLWETQCELDLDQFAPEQFKGEGIPLPFLVTMDKDSHEILAIRRDWNEDDEDCQRRRMYVKYPYVPGPGFYGTGLINILGNSSAAMTAAWREALDAGMYANFPAFIFAKLGGRQNTNEFRLAPGSGIGIETNGMPINQIITSPPYKDITPGLLALIDKITAQAKGLGAAADMPTGEGLQNVPVGTMLAQIEQATKVIAAAHKGMHTAQAEELELIFDLLREKPEDFWRGNKNCSTNWDAQTFLQALDNCKLVPVSDPNVPSHLHRVAKAVALAQLIVNPVFTPIMDAKETLQRILRAMREDEKGLIIDPPPQQGAEPPLGDQAKMVAAQAKVQELPVKQAQVAQKAKADQDRKDIEIIKLATASVVHQDDAAEAQAKAQREGIREVQAARQSQTAMQAEARRDVQQSIKDARDHALQVGVHNLDIAKAKDESEIARIEANKPAPKPGKK